MRERFSMFMRRCIGVLVVISFTANIIMLSAILSLTEFKEPGNAEQHNILHRSEQGAVVYTTMKKQTKKAKEKRRNNHSNEKGQMDFVPPKQVTDDVSDIIEDNKILRKQFVNQDDDENQKVPNTFNEEYIKYFWRHPEFYEKVTNVRAKGTKSYIQDIHKERNKVKEANSDNVTEEKVNKNRELQGKSGKTSFENDNLKHKSNNKVDTLEETYKHINRTKEYHENSKHMIPVEARNSVNQQENLLKHYKYMDIRVQQEMATKTDDINYMTIFPARGQLGNHIFQFASLLGIANRGNFTPFLPKSVFDLNNYFRLPTGFSNGTDVSTFQTFSEDNHTQDTSIKLCEKLNIHRNWSLDGYFQSFKYFSNVPNIVRKHLKFHKHLLQAAVKFIKQTVPTGNKKIAIHIRRGDSISSYQRMLGRVAATPEYVKRAMQYFQTRYNNITFIVVSDDMQWCKEYIKGDNVVYSTTHYREKGVDLAIISRCDHVIISVGTFGWWGGWLAGGRVVYYSKFPRPGSQLDKTFVRENYYPSKWIGLE